MNICDVFLKMADRSPDRLALIDRNRRVSYSELDALTSQGVRDWGNAGLHPRETILFFHPVTIELYVALLSVFRAGMTAMFLDPSAGRSFIDSCCEIHRPDGFFGRPKAHLLRLASSSVRAIPRKFHSAGWIPGSGKFDPGYGESVSPVQGEAAALITFTSGSTGQPKAVARSHEFLIAQHRALENALELHPGEVDLITLPVFALANLGSGLTSVIADTNLAKPGEANAEQVSRQIVDEKVTRCAASPAFFSAMMRENNSLAPLKRIATGGAPVFPPLLDQLKEAAPDAGIFTVYGSTEAEPIAHIEREEIEQVDLEAMKRGAGLLVGTPVPEIELRVIRDQWGQAIPPLDEVGLTELICQPDETGEIVVSGDHVLSGYLGGVGDEETKFRIDDQFWHRTGDAGFLDERGRLWLQGRCSARLEKTGAYPFALECALSFTPSIERCALVEHHGDTVLVVQSPDKTKPDLPENFPIDEIVFADRIPLDRRHQAKTDYPALDSLLDQIRPHSNGSFIG